jgi:hypothetical protein
MESDEISVAAEVGVATALNLNAFDVLRQTPCVPSMTQKFPESWIALLQEWQTNSLGEFERKGTKGKWDNDQQQRYSKRLRAIKVLKQMAGSKKTMKQMANDLEYARIQQNGMSITTHIEMLYKQHIKYKPRAKLGK